MIYLFIFILIEYYDEVENHITLYNSGCVTEIERAYDEFYSLLQTEKGGKIL